MGKNTSKNVKGTSTIKTSGGGGPSGGDKKEKKNKKKSKKSKADNMEGQNDSAARPQRGDADASRSSSSTSLLGDQQGVPSQKVKDHLRADEDADQSKDPVVEGKDPVVEERTRRKSKKRKH